MEVSIFINNFREAFGEAVELPIVFWYSDIPVADTEKINGCFFKGLKTVQQGSPISLSVSTIGCGGGKFYTGFIDMPDHVPNFVSVKEKYKKTPEMVLESINNLGVFRTNSQFLNFARIDKIEDFKNIEGLLFLATPDILSGLATWTSFDNNSDDAISSMFGSGCSAVVTQAVNENKRNGRKTFLGLFDPSVRPHVEENILSFVIPISRFREMYYTIRESCLFDTHAWSKVRERINKPTT
jgi:hypothetical protein